MDAFIARCCLSVLLFTSIGTRASSSETNKDEPREARVSGRIVKLYSGAKPEPYVCINEGFQADPLNCAVFYRCVKERTGKFTVFRYQCAPGTVYDPDVETCNHAHSTRRSECGGMLKPTTAESSQTTNINEIVGAQSEVPRRLSTKVPIYTEQTTYKNPTTLSWIHPTKVPWDAIVHNAQNTSRTSQHKTTAFSSSTSGYQWSKSTQHKSENEHSSKTTLAPKITQQTNLLNNDPCTSDGFMGDSENCRKFYRCVGNQRGGYLKYEFSCSETTVWDDEIQGCNHPWAVKRGKCGRSLTYDDKTEAQLSTDSTGRTTTKEPFLNNEKYGHKLNKTIQQQLQISHGTKVIQTQTQISNSDEVIQNQTQINYHDKNNNIKKAESKQNQKQTSYGTAISQTQTQHDYGNKGVQTQLQIDHSKNSSQSQVQIQDSTTADTVTSQNINNGNNDCSESGFMGDSNDCKKFYRCVNNGRGTYTKYQYFCGDGTVWDPEIEACNHAWAVKNCGSRLPSESTNEIHINTTTTIISTEYHTQPTKTTQSYYTSSQSANVDDGDDIGYGNIQETTSSKTTKEPTIKTTTITISTSTTRPTNITETSTTEKSDGTTNECKSSGFIGDTNDCKIFYRCVDNGGGGFTKYEFKCGDGTLWDPDIEACNHAWAVNNCGGNTSSNEIKEETTTKKEKPLPPQNIPETTLTQITTQVSTQITDDFDTGYGSQTHEPSTTIRTTTQSPKQEMNKNSKCKSSGFQGDENDCKKFYRCVDDGNGSFIKYEFTCGEGTVWDSKIEACNHAWAVEKCGESSNVTENTETTSQSIPTTSTSDTDSTQTTQGNKDTIKPVSTTITSTTSSTVHSVTSNKCSNSGFMGDYSDCKKFYRCVDNGDGSYNRFEFTCGEGTVWDPKIEACNHAWAVENCGGSNELPHTTQQTTSDHSILQDEEQENGYATPSHDSFETSQTTTSSSSLSSTTTLGETGHCHQSGFMGDQKDCKKFYRCVDNGNGGYDKYEFQCGEGTVWDGSIEACNHVWAVKDCRVSGSNITLQNESTTQSITSSVAFEDGQSQQPTEKTTTVSEIHHETDAGDECVQAGFFGSQKDCKKFYRCVENGKGGLSKYEFTCGEGTSWNQDIEGCDHTTADKPCGIMSQDPTYLNDDMVIQTTSTTKITTSTESSGIESTQPTKQPQYSQGSCESEGFHGNPLDCKKFYRCVDNGNGHYIKYDFSCGDGTIWNQDIQACDHESADKTCSGNSSSESIATDYESTSTTSSYSTTKKEATNQIPSQATESECISEGFFAHPNECKKFIRCVNNGNKGYTRYEFSCGDGTVWVQEIQACDHDNEVASCSTQNSSTSKPQSTVEHSAVISESSVISSTESIAPNKENDEYDHESPKQPSHDESEDCTDEGYFGNKQDCKRFYRCVDNGNGGYTKYDFACGDGTAWDSNLQTCNHINEVQSCSESSHENSENHQSTTNKNQAETESLSSTTKQPTTSSSESSSISNSNSQDTCEQEGYFGDSKDCKKFYRCVDNGNGGYIKYDFTCGDGTIWDKDITTCNHPQDVSNPSCTPFHETGDTSSTTTSTTHSSQTTSSTTESSSSSQCTSDCTQESAKKPENNITCDKAGYYANPNDCKKFYRCVDWDGDGNKFSVFNFECGEGTIWDPALDTCNHEESAYPQRNCSQTQSQNVGGETTTSEGTTSTAIEQTTQVQTTSQASATTSATEQTTTQQPTTSEKTTTQESTTNESTTPQQTTTSTTTTTTTHQPTTSEKTTTQQPTTTEPTTQQTTTSEKTTTQETTTSEQTTTQQSTTSEQTTTKEPTTSKETTTQQSTSSETSPTQEPTTSEQTTTQQSPTNEPTTAQQSTTSEQTTTQESTTIESTTNQPAATTDQTTSQESTTSEPTQQTTTNAQTTTESTTSEQATTQQPTTTEQTTTQESTTREQTTTQQSTTTEQTTTQESTTSEQTTQESTTLTDGTTSTEGTTTTEETTDQSSTQTSSTESDTEGQTTTESSSTSEKDCPETDNDQYLLVCPTSFKRHPKYCNMFYQCTEDDDTNEAKVASFKCPNNTIYDENKTQCVTEDKADNKCNGEIANKRRFKRLGLNYKELIIADKGKQSCSGTGHYSFEKSSECSKGFLKCERSKNGQLQGYVYQCPDGFIFWSISKRCERMENVRDCKKSINDWTGRWNIPVERKNVAAS